MALFFRKGDSTISDLDLIKKYKSNGDQNVVADLYSRYITLIYGLCLKYLKNESDSKDAVMEIYNIVSEKLKTHDVDNLKSWIYVVSKNHCFGRLRKEKSTLTKQKQAEVMYSEDVFHPDSIDKESSITQLQMCIKQLPKDQQKCIQLFYFEKKSYQEIVDSSELEWKQVRSFIQNGRRNLKNCMEQKNG